MSTLSPPPRGLVPCLSSRLSVPSVWCRNVPYPVHGGTGHSEGLMTASSSRPRWKEISYEVCLYCWVYSKSDPGTISTYCLSFWDFVRLQTKLKILCLHTKGFLAEDFINTCQNKQMSLHCFPTALWICHLKHLRYREEVFNHFTFSIKSRYQWFVFLQLFK